MNLDNSQTITTQSLLEKHRNTIHKRNQLLDARNHFIECVFHNINNIPFDNLELENETLNKAADQLIMLEQSFIKELKLYVQQQIAEQDIFETRNITHEQIRDACNTMKKNYSFVKPIDPVKLYSMLHNHTPTYNLIESYLTFEHEHQKQFFDIRWDVINS